VGDRGGAGAARRGALWLSKRSLLLHLAVVIWVPGCAVAAWWQVTVAMSGDNLGWLYAVEWPIFAVLGVIGWWQLVHDDPAELEEKRRRRRSRPVPGKPLPGELGPGTPVPGMPAPAHTGTGGGARAADEGPAEVAEPALSRRSVEAIRRAEDDDGELAAYNAYLASLATTGSRKTWRDPTGERTS
jgi:hypothetical protein